jgi:hypothetical protein
MNRIKPSSVFRGLSAAAGPVSEDGPVFVVGAFSGFSKRSEPPLVQRILQAILFRLRMMSLSRARIFSAFSVFSKGEAGMSTWHISSGPGRKR